MNTKTMTSLITTALIFSFLCCSHAGGNDPDKPGKDPEPEKSESTVLLDLSRYNSVSASDASAVTSMWDALHLVSTLQGIVNRDEPRLYIRYIENEGLDVDQWWWDKLIGGGKWLEGRTVLRMNDPVKALEHFKDMVKGLVVYDPAVAATSSLASMVAGVEDLVAVRYDTTPGSLYLRLVKAGYPVAVSFVNDDGSSMFASKSAAYRWAVANYLEKGRCNTGYAAYYPDQYWLRHPGNSRLNHHQLTNHDFFVSKRAFFFDLSPWGDEPATDAPEEPVGSDLAMLKEILLQIYRQNGGTEFCHIGGFPCWALKYSDNGSVGGSHTPVQTEWEFARIISAYNAFKDADAISYGAFANASFWQHYPLQDEYPQKRVTRESLRERGFIGADGKVDRSRKYILFYVGDYDASAWIYQMMPKIWEDSARGSLPLMWCINPVLARRAPMVMDYLRQSASDNDYFAAGDNGAGYLNPGMLEEPRAVSGLPSGVKAWAEHNKPFYKQWGLSITGFIIDGNAPGMSQEGLSAYASFSPDGIVPQKTSGQALLVDGMPVLRYGPDLNGTADESAKAVLANLKKHEDVPFYWYRTILRTPSWHAQVKKKIEEADANAVWMDAPSYFELLRCLLEENK